MSALITLVREEARERRPSLLAAPCVSAAVLSAVHLCVRADFAVAQAAAACVGVLIVLWCVYFAADLFAPDHASGRMRTKSLLPVGALEIWRAKIVFYAVTVIGLAAWTLGFEHALLAAFGSADSLAYFKDALEPIVSHSPFLALIAAATIVCSLVVDSALVALLCSGLVALVLGGVGVALSRGLPVIGVAWGPAESAAASLGGALLLLVLSAVAFARGQARYGSGKARLKVVLSTLGIVLVVGGIAGAGEVYRRVTGSLSDPLATFETASASPDGRWLAIEVVGRSRFKGSQGNGTRSVWVVDIATGDSELVVWPGCLLRDGQNGCALPWDDATSFRAEVLSFEDMRTTDTEVRVARIGEDWQTSACEPGEYGESRIAATWAETTREKRGAQGEYVLRVRWTDAGIEREIVGDSSETTLGLGTLLSLVPGRVFTLRGNEFARHDLADGRTVVLATGVYSVCLSPGGSAVLIRDLRGTRALSLIDGQPMREPWLRDGSLTVVWWIAGEGDPHAVRVAECGRDGRCFVEDLDTGIRFQLENGSESHRVHRLADGRFVHVDRNRDIVIVDARGENARILVDR